MSWSAALPADSSLMVLSAGYIRNNELATQDVLTSSNLTNNYPYIPTAVPVYFYLDSGSVPDGWSLYSSVSDCLLAIKGGSSQYNTTGGTGTPAGTWLGPAYALIPDQIPNLVPVTQVGSSFADGVSNASGGSAADTHEHDWTTTRPYAAVGALYTKNS